MENSMTYILGKNNIKLHVMGHESYNIYVHMYIMSTISEENTQGTTYKTYIRNLNFPRYI